MARCVRLGRGYYGSASDQLSDRGYAIRSVFNWRLPVYAWVFGTPAGPPGALSLLSVLAASSAISAAGAVGRLERFAAATGLVGAYGWLAHPYPAYFTEVWSGLLIFLSASWLARGRAGLGIAAAAIALAFRELSLPYVAIAALMALRRQDRWRFVALLMIIAAFSLAFALHYRLVIRYSSMSVSADCTRWLQFGGTPFLLSTCRMNYLLAHLPAQCTAVYLPLAILGLLGARSPAAELLRATTFAYLGLFAIVGMPTNYYWGWMIVPSLWVGFVLAPAALVDLFAALIRPDRARGGNRHSSRERVS